MTPISISQQLLYGEPNPLLIQHSVSGKTISLHQDVLSPLTQLLEALEKAQLPIAIISSWRSFDYQCDIWNNKWCGKRPLLDRNAQPLSHSQLDDHAKFKALCHWSAVPGTSRHHWGTDFDIFLRAPIRQGYSVQLTPDEFGPDGVCSKLEQWLTQHLNQFGFFRPYQTDRGGVSPEPWHISYYPIAIQCQKKSRATDVARKIMQSNLQGKEVVLEQLENYFQHYVYNVDPCPTH
jgi:LAS superfamily LD-carboxypeptidase LdcB